MEQQPETKSLIQKNYLIIVVFAMAAVAVIGIITMQLLAASLVLALILGIALIARGQQWRSHQHPGCSSSFEAMDDSSIIIAAALFAFIGMALSVWIVWAVALAVLFFIHQSLARIEKHLAALPQLEKTGGAGKH